MPINYETHTLEVIGMRNVEDAVDDRRDTNLILGKGLRNRRIFRKFSPQTVNYD